MPKKNKKKAKEIANISEMEELSFNDKILSAHDVFSFCMNHHTYAETFIFNLGLQAFMASTELQEEYIFKEHVTTQQAHRAIAYEWLADRLHYIQSHGMRDAAEHYPEVRQIADGIREEIKAQNVSKGKETSGLSRRSFTGGLFCLGGTAAIGTAGVKRVKGEIGTVSALELGLGGGGSIAKGAHQIVLDIKIRDFVNEIGRKLSLYIERDANKRIGGQTQLNVAP
ncbi:MAG: hypothetical protein U1E36_05310 [Rickettsiales bacterium]